MPPKWIEPTDEQYYDAARVLVPDAEKITPELLKLLAKERYVDAYSMEVARDLRPPGFWSQAQRRFFFVDIGRIPT